MKVFSVSKNCNACGECVLKTPLLVEDDAGFAVPVPDGYIKDDQLSAAQLIASQCPVKALTIIEKSSVKSHGKAGLEELADVLEQRLSEVAIPDVSRKELKYNGKEYSVTYGQIQGEGRPEHPSGKKAADDGRRQFEEVFWNRRKDFVANILTQYKSKVLRKYYDLRDPEHTYYAEIARQMEAILKNAMAEAKALAGVDFPFPEGFAAFCPELQNHDFKQKLQREYDIDVAMNDYITRYCEGMEKTDLHRKRDYEDRIYATEHIEVIGTDWLGNNKTKTTYSFENASEAGSALVEDLLFYLDYPPQECGLRALDDIYEDNLKYVLAEYRRLVSDEIMKKVTGFKNIVGLTGEADGLTLSGIAAMQDAAGQTLDPKTLGQKLAEIYLKKDRLISVRTRFVTPHFLVFEREAYIFAHTDAETGLFRLEFSTLTETKVPNPEDLDYATLNTILIGDKIIYTHPDGKVLCYDVAGLCCTELMCCDKYPRGLEASDDYVLIDKDMVENGAHCSGIQCFSMKMGTTSLLHRSAPKVFVVGDRLYWVDNTDFSLCTQGHLISSNPLSAQKETLGTVPWNFEPFAIKGERIFGRIPGVVKERTIGVFDRASNTYEELLNYKQNSDEERFGRIGDHMILAEEYNDSLEIYDLNFASAELNSLLYFPDAEEIALIGPIGSKFYYTQRKSVDDEEELLQLYCVDMDAQSEPQLVAEKEI